MAFHGVASRKAHRRSQTATEADSPNLIWATQSPVEETVARQATCDSTPPESDARLPVRAAPSHRRRSGGGSPRLFCGAFHDRVGVSRERGCDFCAEVGKASDGTPRSRPPDLGHIAPSLRNELRRDGVMASRAKRNSKKHASRKSERRSSCSHEIRMNGFGVKPECGASTPKSRIAACESSPGGDTPAGERAGAFPKQSDPAPGGESRRPTRNTTFGK